MKLQIAVTKAVVLAVGFALCGAPELLHAWQQPEPAPVINGTTVNPSQGPLTPTPAAPEPQSPPAPQNEPALAPSTQLSQRPSQPPSTVTTEPLGTATAEDVPANGGGASRPAGTAIAGAKQHQTRSLLLKLGAIAAAGVAVGAVAGLSKATPSTAPGSTRAAAH